MVFGLALLRACPVGTMSDISLLLITASLLGFAVDRYLKSRLVDVVFETYVGHIMQREPREGIQWVIRIPLLARRRIHRISVEGAGNELVKCRSCFVLALILFCCTQSTAEDAHDPEIKCLRKSTHTPISTTQVEQMVAHDAPVVLSNVVIDGDELNLSKRSVRQPLIIVNSLILGKLNFTDAVFSDDFKLIETCVYGPFSGDRAHFSHGANVVHSVLKDNISLYAASINGSLTFDDTLFLGGATFSRIRIENGAYFTRAHFRKGSNFIGALVGYEGVFEGVKFDGNADFERAEFVGSARFRKTPQVPAAIFDGGANFKATKIGGQANFIGVVFNNEVRMTRTNFDEAFFWEAKFLPCNTKTPDCNDVSFSDAEYRVLDFGGNGRSAYFAPERKVLFSGLTFRELRTPVGYVLNILEHNYDRGMYTQLEKLHRDKGERDVADDIYYNRRRVSGDKSSTFLQTFVDRLERYVFGYGVKMVFPIIWIGGLLGVCTLLLTVPDALQRVDAESGAAVGTGHFPWWKRLSVASLVSISALIPKAALPGAEQWKPREQRIRLLRYKLRLTYKDLTFAAKVTAWAIITVSISLFSISDFIKN